MRKFGLLFFAVIILFSMTGCDRSRKTSSSTEKAATGPVYAPVTLKMSYIMADNAVDGVVAAYMKKELSERSNGAITLETYGNAMLASGNQQRLTEMLIAGGSFEMAILGEFLFAAADRRLNVTSIPYAFENYEEAYKYADSTGGEWSKKALEAIGVKYLGCLSNGILQITNNKRVIRTPADAKGLKIRAVGDLNARMTTAIGADAININFSELYPSLQTGTIDGQMNGWLTIKDSSLHEVQPYMTEINCKWSPFDIVANLKSWNELPEATRTLIEEVSKEAALYGREHMNKMESQAIEEFKKSGVTVTILTAEEKKAFRDATESVIDRYKEICGEEACKAWGID